MGWFLDQIKKDEKQKFDIEEWHKNNEIALRQMVRHLIPKPPKPQDYTGTEYTGLIKSTNDLAYWASILDWKHRCRRCDKGMDEYGLCLDCRKLLRNEGRCFECFDKICNLNQSAMLNTGNSTTCTVCVNKSIHIGNPHGYREGGKQSGGLRTNFWTENQADNIAKAREG